VAAQFARTRIALAAAAAFERINRQDKPVGDKQRHAGRLKADIRWDASLAEPGFRTF